ncbi:unnamed protein product, partial [Lymnaea stagnalis]
MERSHVHILLFLTLINPSVRSASACLWKNSFEFEGKCFEDNKTALTYTEARDGCLSIGGVLATVKSKAQIEHAVSYMPPNAEFWIGANDNAVEGNWVWEDDGAPATELSGIWDSNDDEPTNKAGENCGLISLYPTAKSAFDRMCDATYGFLCMEKDPVTSTITTNDPATTNTAASTTETSAATNTAGSTTETSAVTNTAGSTTDTSATALTTSIQPTTSSKPLT